MPPPKKSSSLLRNFTKDARGCFTGSKTKIDVKPSNTKKLPDRDSMTDDVEKDGPSPIELKIRDFIEGKIFYGGAKYLPYNTHQVTDDTNSGYRCISWAVYGSEEYWTVVRKRFVNRLRDGPQSGAVRRIDNAQDLARVIEFEEDHSMADDEIGLVAHEFECNVAIMTISKHSALGYEYVSQVTKYRKPQPDDDGRVDSIDHHFQTLVLVKRGARFEVAREISATTGEVFTTEKRRYEARRLKKQVPGRNIPALFIEGMNDRGITGDNVHKAWAVLKIDVEKDHFNGRKLVSCASRVDLLDRCASEVRRKRKEKGS